MKKKRNDRDVDECAEKIEAILKEYNCEIGVFDEGCKRMNNVDVDLVDIDNKEFVTLVEQEYKT